MAIETARGLLVACLLASGRQVFAINPLAVAGYHDRHSVARKKSNVIDATALANILAAYRALSADTKSAQAIAVLASRMRSETGHQAHNKLRSQLASPTRRSSSPAQTTLIISPP
ncbi:IS110 family transposase [Streptomyces sp. BA2]|uniref:IS110 family transposase n=1 Tax=Streptomyces sp. BA2 TaxID=436595 RepID=UPI001368B4F7|nr:transposase [Streptomyces sp. BA2]